MNERGDVFFLYIEQRKNTSPFSDCPKSHRELERAAALSNNNRARKSERFQQKLAGVAVAGELAPSSTISIYVNILSSSSNFSRVMSAS